MYPKKYTNNLFLLFDPFHDDKELPSGSPHTFQNKPLEPGVKTVVNSHKIKFEPNGDLVDEEYSRYNVNMFDNILLVKLKIMEREAVYSIDQDNENTESNRKCNYKFYTKEHSNSLYSKQRDFFFDFVHNWRI